VQVFIMHIRKQLKELAALTTAQHGNESAGLVEYNLYVNSGD